MTKLKKYGLLIALLLLSTGAVLADVNVEAVAKTPLRFYQAVNGKDYKAAWNILTETSKRRLSSLVASEAKLPVAEVRALFDKEDPAIRDGFWETFRSTAKPEMYIAFTYSYAGPADGGYIVDVTSSENPGGPALKMQVRDEDGYRFGFAESFDIPETVDELQKEVAPVPPNDSRGGPPQP